MSAKVKAGPALRLGPCGVAQGCPRNCEGWAPHPTYADVWQTCWCGHSRGVHAVDLPEPAVIEPVEPPGPTLSDLFERLFAVRQQHRCTLSVCTLPGVTRCPVCQIGEVIDAIQTRLHEEST
jgi:hypothetical protein